MVTNGNKTGTCKVVAILKAQKAQSFLRTIVKIQSNLQYQKYPKGQTQDSKTNICPTGIFSFGKRLIVPKNPEADLIKSPNAF